MECIVGNGEQIRFWANRWLQGKTMAEVAPNLHKKTSRTVVKNRTVAQALHNRAWMGDIKGALTVQVLVEYLHTRAHAHAHAHTPTRDTQSVLAQGQASSEQGVTQDAGSSSVKQLRFVSLYS